MPRQIARKAAAADIATLRMPPTEAAVVTLAGIEGDARTTHESDLRLLQQSRERLEHHRTNLQHAVRLVDGQIEAYDRMIQIAHARAKEL
jgi:hypothetical protein